MCLRVDFDPTIWDGGYFWHEVLYTADSFVHMAIYDMEMKLV